MLNNPQKSMVIAEWQCSQSEHIWIRLSNYMGRNVISLRTFRADATGNERPGKDGITIDVCHSEKLTDAFKKARRIARKRGLIGCN